MLSLILADRAVVDPSVNFWNFLGFFVGASSLIGSLFIGWLTHRHQQEAVKVDRFEAITNALDKRIYDLESELNNEKEGHRATRELLRIALRHIRAILVWSAGPRDTPLPDPPDELLDHV